MQMRYFQYSAILVILLILVLSLAACSASTTTPTAGASPTTTTAAKTSSPPTSFTPPKGGTLTITFAATVNSLYAIKVPGNANYMVYPAVEQLGRQQLDGTYKPFLCESWERDNTALTLTLHLRKGIKFSDGSEFTADVVKWNLQTMTASGFASSLCNPKDFVVVDANTLRIQYSAFSLQWEDTIGSCFIYSKQTVDTNGEDYAKIHPVGTGPFVLKEYVPDVALRYIRNNNYWQSGLPYLDAYDIELIKDNTTLQSSFINGEVDYVSFTDPSSITSMISKGYKNKTVATPGTWSYFVAYPTSTIASDPFNNTSVRQALFLYGIDWKAVANVCTGGFGVAQLQEVGPGAFGYNADLEKASYYDPAKAKAMLKDAGYGDGFKTQIMFTNAVYNAGAAAIQDQLKSYNITATVNLNTAASTLRNEGKTAAIHLFSTSGYSVDPTFYILQRMCKAGQYGKMINFSDAYQAAITRLQSATTQLDKIKALQDIYRIDYVDESYGRTAWAISQNIFISDKVHNSGLDSMLYTPELAYKTK